MATPLDAVLRAASPVDIPALLAQRDALELDAQLWDVIEAVLSAVSRAGLASYPLAGTIAKALCGRTSPREVELFVLAKLEDPAVPLGSSHLVLLLELLSAASQARSQRSGKPAQLPLALIARLCMLVGGLAHEKTERAAVWAASSSIALAASQLRRCDPAREQQLGVLLFSCATSGALVVLSDTSREDARQMSAVAMHCVVHHLGLDVACLLRRWFAASVVVGGWGPGGSISGGGSEGAAAADPPTPCCGSCQRRAPDAPSLSARPQPALPCIGARLAQAALPRLQLRGKGAVAESDEGHSTQSQQLREFTAAFVLLAATSDGGAAQLLHSHDRDRDNHDYHDHEQVDALPDGGGGPVIATASSPCTCHSGDLPPSSSTEASASFTLAEIYERMASRQQQGGTTRAPLRPFPLVLSPGTRLRLLLPHLAVFLAMSATFAAAAASQPVQDGEIDLDEVPGPPSEPKSGAELEGALSPMARALYGAVVTALQLVLADCQAVSSAAVSSSSAPPSYAGSGLLGLQLAPMGAAAAEASPEGGLLRPELVICQSLVSLATMGMRSHQERLLVMRSLGGLLQAFHPGARFALHAELLGSCPSPPTLGLLLDGFRNELLRQHAPPGPASGSPNPFLDNERVFGLLSGALAERLRGGLTWPAGLADIAARTKTPSAAQAEQLLESSARYMASQVDADVALLGLLRSLLLLQRQRRQQGGKPQQALLTSPRLKDLLDGYLRPLAEGVHKAQALLRGRTGLGDLVPHASAATASSSAAAAEHSRGTEGVTVAARMASLPAPEAPRSDAHATLSKLFLLEAALAPVVELADAEPLA